MRFLQIIRNKLGPARDPRHDAWVARGNADYSAELVDVRLHHLLLIGKLHAEVEEIRAAPEDASEYADVLQALTDLAASNGVDWWMVLEKLHRKENIRGDFSEPYVMGRPISKSS